jgi:hypothetical protein
LHFSTAPPSVCLISPIILHITFTLSSGINILSKPSPDLTHLLTPTLSLTPPAATALLAAARFVTPTWLTEVLRLGHLPAKTEPSQGIPLEEHFILPLESQFKPEFDADLPVALKSAAAWDADEGRVGMLRKKKFVCVEKGREMKSMVEAGGGEYEVLGLDVGSAKWRTVLTKAKKKLGAEAIVLVAEEQRHNSNWKNVVAEAKRFV